VRQKEWLGFIAVQKGSSYLGDLADELKALRKAPRGFVCNHERRNPLHRLLVFRRRRRRGSPREEYSLCRAYEGLRVRALISLRSPPETHSPRGPLLANLTPSRFAPTGGHIHAHDTERGTWRLDGRQEQHYPPSGLLIRSVCSITTTYPLRYRERGFVVIPQDTPSKSPMI